MTRPTALLLVIACIAAAAGQLLFRVGAQNRTQLAEFVNPAIAGGLVLYALGTLLWIYALARERLVVVYAFSALTFVLVYAGGTLLLNEAITLKGAVGVALVLTGLYLVAV
jgi:undecaprenyl phosphate-alpha-L-ara4N flippase subunit ArnE